MRVGISAWAFTGDNKIENGLEVSTPDGNSTYTWSMIWEMRIKRGYTVYWMQKNRDAEACQAFGDDNFSAFSKNKRVQSYVYTIQTGGVDLPELDVLLVEWRWPIPGRNTELDKGKPGYQEDFERQTQLLRHYKEQGTKIILLELDHKITEADEIMWQPDAIFEPSVKPRRLTMERTHFEFPTIVKDLLQFPTQPIDPTRSLVYVGSRYERDDVITEWIKPVSRWFPKTVHFYGNWYRTIDECKKLWPNVVYHDRITTRDFRDAYSSAIGCPLLSKPSYLESGFMTPRVWEALLFGTIPIGLGSFTGIEKYCNYVAKNARNMIDIIEGLGCMSLKERDDIRINNVEKLEPMDAKHFVDLIERV